MSKQAVFQINNGLIVGIGGIAQTFLEGKRLYLAQYLSGSNGLPLPHRNVNNLLLHRKGHHRPALCFQLAIAYQFQFKGAFNQWFSNYICANSNWLYMRQTSDFSIFSISGLRSGAGA